MKWDLRTFWKNLRKHHYFSWIIYGLLALMMFLVMINGVMPKKLNVKLYDIAKTDIQSPIEIVDQTATETKRKDAMAAVPTAFAYNKDAATIQVEKAQDIFSTIQEVRNQSTPPITTNSTTSTQTSSNTPSSNVKSGKSASINDEVKQVRKILAANANKALTDNTIKTLLTVSNSQFNDANNMTDTAIDEAMGNKIKWSDLEKVQKQAIASIPKTTQIDNTTRQAITNLLQYEIIPNYVLDAKTTQRNRDQASKAVGNVVIHQGEVIVKKGDLVTQDVMRKLKEVGLLDDKFNPLPFLGLGLLVVFLTILLGYDLNRTTEKAKRPSSILLMYTVIFAFVMVVLKISSLLTMINLFGVRYVVPIAVGTMMIKLLINERLAIVTSIVFAICGSMVYQTGGMTGLFDFQMGVYLLFSSLAGALFVRRYDAKPKLLQSGLIIAFVNVILVLCISFIKNGTINLGEMGLNVGFAALSGLISTVLTFGLVPFLEAAFGILSTTRLIELSNPNHPLLRKILMQAPGTYHHSLMVANLAERACEQIGANGLLARVAAYYHDLGKTKRPHFFIENQLNQVNPHDKISPQLSRTIIISHPYDGAALLREHNIPKEIIDIAEQHHGTTLLKYFYYKAKEGTNQDIPESDFRYPGPKAQTREAAVVELCDSCEAAVRSLSKPTPVKIESLVQKILNDRLEDGQFDECDLTMKELYMIKQSICETLNGVFHSRIEYPEEIDKKVKSG